MVDAASIVRAFDPRESKLNILLLAVPATVYFNYFQHDENLSFITSMIAIMPLAFLMGKATEEIALRTSESVGGLLNATFGNAAEIIICVSSYDGSRECGYRNRRDNDKHSTS